MRLGPNRPRAGSSTATISHQQLQTVTDSSGFIVAARVKHDMKRLPSGGRLGSTYWRQIRLEYGFDKVRVEVSTKDPNMAVGDDLLMALKVLLDRSSATRCIAPLTNLLTYRSSLNQRELVGIVSAFNTLHDISMVNRASQEQLWVDLEVHRQVSVGAPLGFAPLGPQPLAI